MGECKKCGSKTNGGDVCVDCLIRPVVEDKPKKNEDKK